jgi:hypothetical protein
LSRSSPFRNRIIFDYVIVMAAKRKHVGYSQVIGL